ncbi:MAG: 5-carboxymethyl-2-hydroxymuconate isomerase [Rhodobacter sp.]|nr:5-carboxymethyl-2-hydroxymuconate isomerase [Rhodobacter sp.]
MPHVSIEYSPNLEDAAGIQGLCEALRHTAAGLDIFQMTGIRVRATRVDHYAIADGDPENGFIDISVRLRGGRPLAVRRAAAAALFDAAETHLADLLAARPVMLSLEMRDIDPELSPKRNTVRDHIARKKVRDE